MRKLGALESMEGLFLESLVLVLPAFLYLLYLDSNTASDFVAYPLLTKLLLAGAGPVTAIPLIMFAAGARRISMTTLGLLQYLAPTLQFACAVGLYGEAFTADNLVTFGLIWVALGIYSCDSYRC